MRTGDLHETVLVVVHSELCFRNRQQDADQHLHKRSHLNCKRNLCLSFRSVCVGTQEGVKQNVQFLCRPFHGARPTEDQWFSLVANLEKLHLREGLDLVVIDTLATLLPGYAETCAPKMLDCLMPLQALANLG
jgi:hypothetical protein